jgi:DNA replication ATP-dependent helicase Dna2
MASRARAKLVVLVTQEVVDHLASDVKVLRESRLLKAYAESFCQSPRPMTLGYVDQTVDRAVSGTFKCRR